MGGDFCAGLVAGGPIELVAIDTDAVFGPSVVLEADLAEGLGVEEFV